MRNDMKLSLAIIAALLLATPLVGLLQAAPPPAPDDCRWVLDERFSDEFEGTSLDMNKLTDHFTKWRGPAIGSFTGLYPKSPH